MFTCNRDWEQEAHVGAAQQRYLPITTTLFCIGHSNCG